MRWLSRLAALFRKRKLDAELDDELRFHLEMETRKNVRNATDADGAPGDCAVIPSGDGHGWKAVVDASDPGPMGWGAAT